MTAFPCSTRCRSHGRWFVGWISCGPPSPCTNTTTLFGVPSGRSTQARSAPVPTGGPSSPSPRCRRRRRSPARSSTHESRHERRPHPTFRRQSRNSTGSSASERERQRELPDRCRALLRDARRRGRPRPRPRRSRPAPPAPRTRMRGGAAPSGRARRPFPAPAGRSRPAPPGVNTRSLAFPSRISTGWIRARSSAAAVRSTGNGCDSPSVSTTAIRVRASGAKKRAVARSPSAPSDVPLPPMFSAGGGRWTAIASRSVTSKSARSSVGKRCGSTRSVSEAIPTAAVGSRVAQRLRDRRRALEARRRPGVRVDASIDRDVSITTNTSASRRTVDSSWDATTG